MSDVAELTGRLRALGVAVRVIGDETATITGATLDSRRVDSGDLYAALPGFHVHGADFAHAAIAAGAAAVLTDDRGQTIIGHTGVPLLVTADPRAVLGELSALIFGSNSADPALYGVTGTDGKTTTTYILDAFLAAAGFTTGLVGTIETRIAGSAVPSARTTPESPDLHRLLQRMRDAGVTACSMEVSSHALSLHRVDGAQFDVVGFTNLSQDHLDFHGTMEAYFAAKASLFDPRRARRGVVVIDDEWGRRLARTTDLAVTTVSSSPPASGTADYWIEDADGATFTLVDSGGGRLPARAPLAGDFNRTNTALAMVMLLAAGIDRATVGTLEPDVAVPGRMEIVSETGPRAIVDFAHTPESIARALAALRQDSGAPAQHSPPLTVVFGAGGDRDRAKRYDMGRLAAAAADLVIVTDDNPRTEDPAGIRAEILKGARAAPGHAEVIEVAGRQEAIDFAIRSAETDATVLIAGKGHEPGQEVAGTVHPFDDREEVRRALAALPANESTDG